MINYPTVEQIIQAYKDKNLKAYRGAFFQYEGTCACGFGAYYASNFTNSETDLSLLSPSTVNRALADKFGEGWVNAFYCGFDGVPNNYANYDAYNLGKATWEAVVKEGLVYEG